MSNIRGYFDTNGKDDWIHEREGIINWRFDLVGFEDLLFLIDKCSDNRKWLLAGPNESTRLKNNLNHVTRAEFSLDGNRVDYDPFRNDRVMDYTSLMRSENKTSFLAADIEQTRKVNSSSSLSVLCRQASRF